jgi:hypothetical protein
MLLLFPLCFNNKEGATARETKISPTAGVRPIDKKVILAAGWVMENNTINRFSGRLNPLAEKGLSVCGSGSLV